MNIKGLIKREIVVTIVSILLMTTIFFGISYAVYLRVDEKDVGTIGMGDLTFEMCTDMSCSAASNLGTVITGELYPMNQTEGLAQTPYTFIATNNGNKTVYITVYAATQTDLTYDYSKVNIAGKLSTDSSYTIERMTNQVTIIKENIQLSVGESKTISVLVWGTEELNNDLIGQTFHTFINAIGYYYPNDPNSTYGAYIANVSVNLLKGITFNYTGGYQEWEAPLNGYYNIEAWGASGGDSTYSTGGNGGYTSGKIYLEQGETIYIYVGGSAASGGYNGGSSNTTYTGGGGASDVRYFGSTTPNASTLLWNNSAGLNSRIMVASGGGGAALEENGFSEGLLIGSSGISQSKSDYTVSAGGTQISGGTGAITANYTGGAGTFGIGGILSGNNAGGGAGYYGGGSGIYEDYNEQTGVSGANGSSYISGYAGVNSVTSGSTANPRNHANITKHYSGKYFLDGKISARTISGDGKVKITYVGLAPMRANASLDGVRYIKDCATGSNKDNYVHWTELQAIYNGENKAKGVTPTTNYSFSDDHSPGSCITDGDFVEFIRHAASSNNTLGTEKCITIDLGSEYNLDEIAVWHYWEDGRTYASNVTSVSTDGNTWTAVINETAAETSKGKRVSAY